MHALQSANRWAVSGTPLEAPEDLQAVLTFLRAQPFGDRFWWDAVLSSCLAPQREASRARESAAALLSLIGQRDARLAAAQQQMAQLYGFGAQDYGGWRGGGLRYDVERQLSKPMSAAVEAAGLPPCSFWELEPSDVQADRLAARAQLAAEAEVASKAICRRFGVGLGLLRSLLRPILWRNTKARVTALGELALPPVTELVVRMRLSAGEERVHSALAANYNGLVAQLKVLLECADAEARAAATRAAAEAASSAAAALGAHAFASASINGEVLRRIAQNAVWDLRAACAALGRGGAGRAAKALGLAGGARLHGCGIADVVRAFLTAAEERVDVAARQSALSKLKSAASMLHMLQRLDHSIYVAPLARVGVLRRRVALAAERLATRAKAAK